LEDKLPDLPPRTHPPTPEELTAGRSATANLVGSIYRMFRGQGKRDRVVAAGRPAAEKAAQAIYAAIAEREWIAQLRATRRPPPDLRLLINRRLGRLPHGERLTQALSALDDRPMCNRYQVRTAQAEALQLKLGLTSDRSLNYAGEVYPGYTGLVIAADETGQPQARAMTWGFPLVLTGKQGQPLKPKPVNNAREDKLGTWMWRDSFERRRCLIPASAWAEAEGERGKMTCTWHAMPDREPMMLAGIWRPTEEWGDAYSMVMVDGCPQMAQVHDRMPVILREDNWRRWLAGAPAEAFPLCETWLGDLAIDRTTALWAARE
jgi:putative SOS response-associated peptidase YedK